MAEMLSPGVFVTEIDASSIVPTVSSSIAVFGGDFSKGPVNSYTLITSVADLISFYGTPTNTNFNDWYQTYDFLQYGNKLLVSRAANMNGVATQVIGTAATSGVLANASAAVVLGTGDGASFTAGDIISFEVQAGQGADLLTSYLVQAVTVDTLTLDRLVQVSIPAGSAVFTVQKVQNSVFEPISTGGTAVTDAQYFGNLMQIGNIDDFYAKELSIAFSNTSSKLKFIGRDPGAWANNLEICIATPTAFDTATPSEAFTGIALDALFQYPPTGTEIGVVIRENGIIVETWVGDFNTAAKDQNNKSTYIESVINSKSSYVYVKDNTGNTTGIQDYCASVNGISGSTLTLRLGTDSPIQNDDLLNAYDIFSNKEALDIDIVIGNELDNGLSAKGLCDTRLDCIGFIGANYADCVGQKAATAVSNLITWRKTGALNYNDMFLVAIGNYQYRYDRYNDKYRWCNIAGQTAGLRAQTSSNRASWWASAGLERGQYKGITKLAFSPTMGQRDLLYKNGINPAVSFPGQGTVLWGQKTLLDKPSSFDRVNVRGLF